VRFSPARRVRALSPVLASALWINPAFAATPWRLSDASPDWLTLSAVERYRVEVMDNTFRAVDPGFDQMTSSRFLLAAEANVNRWFAGFEFQDSRAWWHDEKTPVGTADVNAAEFLQAYLGLRLGGVFAEDDQLTLQAGRMVISMGNKRIVARNGYRNTINGFTGGRLVWEGEGGAQLQAFYTLPMERLPDIRDRQALRDNDVENDKSTANRVLWGAELSQVALTEETSGDLFLVGYRETDRPSLPVLKRQHYTLGFRAYDTRGPWQWEIEAAWQWGESRATVLPSDTDDLDHRAALVHAEISRGLALSGSPRVFLKYDYASGDSDPADGRMERFDTLFAARSRDFGLLGLYGPFFFSNLNSPALGVIFEPAPRVTVESFYRPARLAEKRDRFVGSGLADHSGASGDRLGQQFHVRLDWDVLPRRLSLMFGAAWLNKGRFLQDAPRAPDNGDTLYGVTQFTLSF
jgi:hypothetical protein